MTDQGKLLRAILRDPEDDTVRLAYADWLDETAGYRPCLKCMPNYKTENGLGLGWLSAHDDTGHFPVPCTNCGGVPNKHDGSGRVSDGNHERAEFIRVQIELAKNPTRPATIHFPVFDKPGYGGKMYIVPPPEKKKEPCGWCPVCVNRKRERELWNNPRRVIEWFPLPDGVSLELGPCEHQAASSVSVTRGFVGELHTRLEYFDRDAQELFARHPITQVNLRDRVPNWPGGGAIGHFYCWLRVDDYPVLMHAGRHTLPPALFAELRGGASPRAQRLRDYPTLAEAYDDLSDACVRYGRKLASITDT